MYYNINDDSTASSDIVVYRCALKHGVDPADALTVAYNPRVVRTLSEDPWKWLCMGFTDKAVALEVIVVREPQGSLVLIHAMKLRKRYWPDLARERYRPPGRSR